jgi:hypothetical protein
MRLLAVAAMAAGAAACARDANQVSVGIGTAAYVPADAHPYAAFYLPYAKMASLAYTDPPFLTQHSRPNCPSEALLSAPALIDEAHPAANSARAARWLVSLRQEGWECLFGGIGPLDCPPGIRCVDGLQYQIWRRRDCSEAVIAFRGSDRGDAGDWQSNFRWFRIGPVFDEYDQVDKAIRGIIDDLDNAGCRPKRLIATGHSLGGGLGQHVAFADGRIDYVYAFDPSPVTAHFLVPELVRTANVGTLGIDRIYQSGEVLSLPRYIVSGIAPTPQCQPRVRTVRFDAVTATSRVERHRIAALTEGLERLAAAAPHGSLPVAFNEARTCTFAQADQRG